MVCINEAADQNTGISFLYSSSSLSLNRHKQVSRQQQHSISLMTQNSFKVRERFFVVFLLQVTFYKHNLCQRSFTIVSS